MKDLNSLFCIDTTKIHAITLPQVTPKDAISLHLGYPDPNVFPHKEILKASEYVLKNDINSLQYCEEIGDLNLRKNIYCKYYNKKENDNENNVLITHGTTDALEILIKLFIKPGDYIITEAPSYLWALRVFKMADANIINVPIDSEGIIIDTLEKTIKELISKKNEIKFIYVIPDFQNPSGVSMSLTRRKALLKIANKYNVMIVEDNPYHDLRYWGKTIPTLFDLDSYNVVLQARTFSKTMGPGIRLGWIIGPDVAINGLTRMKQTGSCTLTSIIASRFLNSESYDNNIEYIKQYYRKKCQSILEAMNTFLPDDIDWYPPEGGFYIWIKLPKKYPIDEIYNSAAMHKVLFLKGADFFSQENECNDIRLSFSYESPERLVEGIQNLSLVLKNAC